MAQLLAQYLKKPQLRLLFEGYLLLCESFIIIAKYFHKNNALVTYLGKIDGKQA